MTAGPEDPHIGLVVEGRGELESVPLLLRTHRGAVYQDYRDILGKPVPCHGRDKALVPDGLEGYVATAAGRPGCRAVVVLLDSEGDAACQVGPALTQRASAITGKPVHVSLAEPKYEAWVVASAETLGLAGLTFPAPGDPTAAIKAVLSVKYVKPTWQPRLTARMDLDLAAGRAASLRRLLDRFDALVDAHFP